MDIPDTPSPVLPAPIITALKSDYWLLYYRAVQKLQEEDAEQLGLQFEDYCKNMMNKVHPSKCQ